MNKEKIKQIRNNIYKNKMRLYILSMIVALLINIASISTVVYFHKNSHKTLIYETMSFVTINNNATQLTEEKIEEEEEKPIVIKKAQINDKEDGEKKYSDASTSSAKSSNIEEAKALYETTGTSIGIDVSKWNYNIDWKKVADSGVEFAIIRCGYRGYGSGEILMDPYFEQNISGALKNGIKVGIYFFSAAINEAEAKEEARWVVNVIKKYRITYPVAYDFESFGMGRLAGLSNTQMTNNANAFLNYIKSSGYTPMMYASRNAYYQRWETSRITGCKFWLAHYTDKTDYSGSYQMWQYTSKGSVPGISTNVDMNIAYFKYSTEAPAKEPEQEVIVEEKETTPETKTTTNNEITFNEQLGKVITTKDTKYYNNISDNNGYDISKDTIMEQTAISDNKEWTKATFNNTTIYIKSEYIKSYVEENEN